MFHLDFIFKQYTNSYILQNDINFELGNTLSIATDLLKKLLRRVLSDA